MRPIMWRHFIVFLLCLCLCLTVLHPNHAIAGDPNFIEGLVQNQDLPQLRSMANKTIVPYHDMPSNIGTGADYTILADNRRASDNRSTFNPAPFAHLDTTGF